MRADVYHQGSLSGVDLRLQDAQAVLGRLQLQRLASRQGACIGLVLLSLGVALQSLGLAFLQRPLSRCQFSQARLQVDVFLLELRLHLGHGLFLGLYLLPRLP
jgi:hypothetical protein